MGENQLLDFGVGERGKKASMIAGRVRKSTILGYWVRG
jgi:hypothetical protein